MSQLPLSPVSIDLQDFKYELAGVIADHLREPVLYLATDGSSSDNVGSLESRSKMLTTSLLCGTMRRIRCPSAWSFWQSLLPWKPWSPLTSVERHGRCRRVFMLVECQSAIATAHHGSLPTSSTTTLAWRRGGVRVDPCARPLPYAVAKTWFGPCAPAGSQSHSGQGGQRLDAQTLGALSKACLEFTGC